MVSFQAPPTLFSLPELTNGQKAKLLDKNTEVKRISKNDVCFLTQRIYFLTNYSCLHPFNSIVFFILTRRIKYIFSN